MEIFELLFLVFVLGEEQASEIVIPDLSAISFIELQILLIISISVLFSLILTFGILCIIEILSSFKNLFILFFLTLIVLKEEALLPSLLIYIKKRKMETVFIQLAIILLVAFIVSYIARAFKQPAIVGYIIAGMIISPFVFKFGASLEITNFFSKLGVAFLLFIVGLHMNPKIIKEVGVFSLVIGLVQMIVTFLIGLALSFYVLHFNLITSSYIGIALAFSSTIIVLKLLSDRRQLESLYGKISIGILLTQDLVAIIILMFISSESSGISLGSFALKGLLGGGALIVVLFLLGFTILPVLVKNIARNQELLFLFSIMWAFVIAGLFNFIGFSLEIGALLAGVVLSISPYSIEISSKVHY